MQIECVIRNIGVNKQFTFDKIYAKLSPELSEDFKKDTRVIFKDEAQNIDFRNPSRATREINNYVSII